MSEVIVVTSGKGGVGKTTTSANLGTGLAMLLEVAANGVRQFIEHHLPDVVTGCCVLGAGVTQTYDQPCI